MNPSAGLVFFLYEYRELDQPHIPGDHRAQRGRGVFTLGVLQGTGAARRTRTARSTEAPTRRGVQDRTVRPTRRTHDVRLDADTPAPASKHGRASGRDQASAPGTGREATPRGRGRQAGTHHANSRPLARPALRKPRATRAPARTAGRRAPDPAAHHRRRLDRVRDGAAPTTATGRSRQTQRVGRAATARARTRPAATACSAGRARSPTQAARASASTRSRQTSRTATCTSTRRGARGAFARRRRRAGRGAGVVRARTDHTRQPQRTRKLATRGHAPGSAQPAQEPPPTRRRRALGLSLTRPTTHAQRPPTAPASRG